MFAVNTNLWRIVRVTPTSAKAWDQTGAALARRKHFNHYPIVAACFCCAVSRLLHRSSPQLSRLRAWCSERLLVSEMLKRSVEEENCTQWRSDCSDLDTVCDL